MRTRILLENNELDLFEDIDTTFTFAIDDVKDFSKRNTSYSKTIQIPGNSINNKAFGHVFNLGSSNAYDLTLPNFGYNFNPAISARVIVLIDQVQIFKGSLRLTEIINTDGTLEYQCFMFGELGGFVFQLGNKRLEDLDFSDYNLAWTYNNIVTSFNRTNGTGVVFPLIDYGNVSTNKKDFQYKAFRPALFVREYLERIFSGTDYTVQSNFLLDPIFDRLVIPHNQAQITKNNTGLLSRTGNAGFIDDAINGLIPFELGVLGSFTTSDNESFAYTGSAAVVNIKAEVVIAGYEGFPSDSLTLILKKNGTTIATVTGITGTGLFTLNATGVNLVPTDIIEVGIQSILITLKVSFQGELFSVDAGTPQLVPVSIGDTITINDCIPKGIFQKDFFLWIVKMFNLYVYESPFDDKTIIISPYINFYNGLSLDWSSKVDRKEPIRSIPMSELNARYFQYKFKDDNDFYSEQYRKRFTEGYGDFIFDSTFEFAKETDVLEIGFTNSVLYQNVGEDKVFGTTYKLSGSTETTTDHNIRIGQIKNLNCVNYNILNVAVNLGATPNYLYCGHVNDPVTPTSDLSFGAPSVLNFRPTSVYPSSNLFNTFHSAYMAEITDKDSKIVILRAYLNTVDVMNLDFSKLIYIDGVLFRINKIANYNPIDLGTTEIQLLKVIDL